MSTNRKAPKPRSGKSDNSMSYSPGSRAAHVDTNSIKGYKETALSKGGLSSIAPGCNPDQGTNSNQSGG